MDTDALLTKLRADHKLLNKGAFALKARQVHPHIQVKDITAWQGRQAVNQVFAKPPFKGFFKITSPPKSFQVDVFLLDKFKASNDGVTYFLFFVDICSRKWFVYPMKNNSDKSLVTGLESFAKAVPDCYKLEGDDQFSHAPVVAFCTAHKFGLFTDIAENDHQNFGDRLGIVDIAVRDIRRMISKYMAEHDTTRYIDDLQAMVDAHNDSPCRVLNNITPYRQINTKTPNEVYADRGFQNAQGIRLNQANNMLDKKVKQTLGLKLGDTVRVSVDKGTFSKESAKFSANFYKITEVVGRKYCVTPLQGGSQLPRKYKYFEMLKVDPSKVQGSVGGVAKVAQATRKAQAARRLKREGLD